MDRELNNIYRYGEIDEAIDTIRHSFRNEEGITNKDKHKMHADICKELNELYIKKNKEYGDSFGKAYRHLGLISAIGQIYHKVQRLTQIYDKDDIDYESLSDNLKDASNYCIMTLVEMKKEQENK